MTLKKTLLLICLFISSIFSYGQIRISEVIKQSEIVSNNQSKLYFIDFWATWCAPCISASKYLTVLQKQHANDLHIVSLSQENAAIVTNFLTKHNLQLTTAIDYDGETFKKYNVQSLPYGVLIDANGNKLWEGHPANLKAHTLQGFVNNSNYMKTFEDVFEIITSENTVAESYLPREDIEIEETNVIETEDFQIINKHTYVELQGRLNAILAYGWKVNINQVNVDEADNKYYKLYLKKNSKHYRNFPDTFLKKLKMKLKTQTVLTDSYVLDMNASTLWDTFQIDWEDNPERFLIGDSDIKADNVSVNDMVYMLSKVLEKPVVVKNSKSVNNERLHDWDIHYKFYDLMVSNLSDNYGIKLEKTKTPLENYLIIKKAP